MFSIIWCMLIVVVLGNLICIVYGGEREFFRFWLIIDVLV